MSKNQNPSNFVDENRLWKNQMLLAQIGATPKGGVNRQALSSEEIEARELLLSWSERLKLTTFVDQIGNLFFRLNGTASQLAPVMTGSHIDSQPTGGKFDGSYGVIAGFEALEAIIASGVTVKRPIEVAVWLNEEGSRFAPGMMGSEAYVGVRELGDMLEIVDTEGVSVAAALPAALAASPNASFREFKTPVFAFVENHIEQGPVLEAEKLSIGVVTGIQGVRRMRVRVSGEEAHAGTTPPEARRDALQWAAAVVTRLHEEITGDPDTKFTVGMMKIEPNVPSVLASDVVFSVDIRHPNSTYLEKLASKTENICEGMSDVCEIKAWRIASSDTIAFDDNVINEIECASKALGVSHKKMLSAAGHDARQLSYFCPTGMIFVPCEKGISHNEAENATACDLGVGAKVLADVLVGLANSG